MDKEPIDNKFDDTELKLPADTLKILQEFLEEKEKSQLLESSTKEFKEDWQLSQFWYSDATKQTLAGVCLKIVKECDKSDDLKIALLSCPSLYESVKNIHSNVRIFEYDKRFSNYGEDFVFYDYNEGDKNDYLIEYHKTFDIIIVDPPFLSEECLQKTSNIVKNLMNTSCKLILCTGEVMTQYAERFLGLHKCNYSPEHERNLGNEFSSYANFNLDEYIT